MLREDPRSIFSPDVEIENTLGPLAYDVSRVFTGTLAGMCESPFPVAMHSGVQKIYSLSINIRNKSIRKFHAKIEN